MDQIVERQVEVEASDDIKTYKVDVNVNEEFLESVDDKVFIHMKPLKNEDGVDTQLSFESNHKYVNKDLNVVLEHIQHWFKEGLDNNVISSKLQELDRMQYAQNIPCNEIGAAVARLYQQYVTKQ